MPKEIKISVTQLGSETGVNIHSEEISDPIEAMQILGIAIQALQQKVVNNSKIIFPPPGKSFGGN